MKAAKAQNWAGKKYISYLQNLPSCFPAVVNNEKYIC
jgi:hypothetical protein